MSCLFCEIEAGRIPAAVVFEDQHSIAFLDHRPLFHGHVLLIPRQHVETLPDVPAACIVTLFSNAQRLTQAVESAMNAQGTFVAINNRVSQSVPHLHVHVVPRRPKDGLRGFFWPRQKYETDEQMVDVAARIRSYVSDSETSI